MSIAHSFRQTGLARSIPAGLLPLIGLAAGLTVVAAITGCTKPLLSPDEERTPFDRYDGIRAQYAPQYTTDEYGMKKPNLRSRLSGKD